MSEAVERPIDDDIEVVNGETMIRSSHGNLMPVSGIRAHVLLADATARGVVRKMLDLAEHNARVKQEIFDELTAYQDLMFERYRARVGGRRGGLTVASVSDRHKVEVSTADYSRVTAALPAAQALMNEILDDLTGNVDANLRTLIMAAFERDEKTGRVNVQRLSGLRKYDLKHPKWPDFIRAISDAIEPAGSKTGVRAYTRDTPDGQWKQVVVDFSRV